jgi:hypothetical protein
LKLRDLLRQYIVSKEKADKTRLPENQTQRGDKIEKPQHYRMTGGGPYDRNRERHYVPKYATGSLIAGEKKSITRQFQRKCRYCEGAHWSDECTIYKSIDDRKRRLKSGCFKCLKDSHKTNECKSSKLCVYCGKVNVHHRSLCDKKFSKHFQKESVHLSEEILKEENPSEEAGLLSLNETVLMQTVLTDVRGAKSLKSEKVRLILDSGSHRSYIAKSLADRLKLKGEKDQEINIVTFGSERSRVIKTKTTKLNLKMKNGDYLTIEANIVPSISGMMQRTKVKDSQKQKLLEFTKDLTLADSIPTETKSDVLELLLGNDYYLDVIESEKIKVSPGLYLLSSKFGWIISGRTELDETIQDTYDAC